MIRYSTFKPERLATIGSWTGIAISSQRRADSAGVIFIWGSAAEVLCLTMLCDCGLEQRSGAVTPASLMTLTRNVRQPFSIKVGLWIAGATLTRLSGLMLTTARHRGSSVFWISETTAESSDRFSNLAKVSSIESSKGSPRNRMASRKRLVEASSGCLGTEVMRVS